MSARDYPAQPTRPVSDWPPYRTDSGVQIGKQFRPLPFVDMDADELAIQRALLPDPPQPIPLHDWALYLIGGAVCGWFGGSWLVSHFPALLSWVR